MPTSPDSYDLRILFRADPLATWEAAKAVLAALLQHGHDLAPTTFRDKSGKEPLTLDAVARRFDQRKPPEELSFIGRGVSGLLVGYDGDRDPGGRLQLSFTVPFVAGRAATLFGLALELCRAAAPLYGWAHAPLDVRLGRDPTLTDPFAPTKVYQAYWLTILGAPIVKELGREKVASTPAHRVELLHGGGALIVTSPDPADFASPDAREAQARALAHLRPDLHVAQIREDLRARSAALAAAAVPPAPAPPPPEPTEWLPAAGALPPDVDDENRAVRGYADDAERFIAGFHDEIPHLIGIEPPSVAAIDAHFVGVDYWASRDVAKLESLFVPWLGAYLGVLMVRELGGRWVPRRNLEEAQVIVGDRAWLPFLRVKRFVQSKQACKDHSLARFFAEAKAVGGARPLA